MTPAPIVLFTYNRPEHTRRTVEALQRNSSAAESDLFIYSDGPRPGDEGKVTRVRAYLKTVAGFRSVTVIERNRNWGLADSIVDGVTTTVGCHGRVIVLEDDIITAPAFLSYMNDALEQYADTPEVMHIGGYMFPLKDDRLPERFFLRQSLCWGWGTWARAWRYFHRDAEQYIGKFNEENIRLFNMNGAYDYWAQLLANNSGKMRTWAVYWYACVFSRGGLCLSSRDSFVANIGFDGSGENCGVAKHLNVGLRTVAYQPFSPVELRNDEDATRLIGEFLRRRLPLLKREFSFLRFMGKMKKAAKNILRIGEMCDRQY